MKGIILTQTLVWMLTAYAGFSAEPALQGKLDGWVITTGARLLLIDSVGKQRWSCKAGNCADVWMLPNGNVLFANGSVIEVDPRTDQVVFTYTPEETKGGGSYACQRLEKGITLVAENSAGRIVEVDPAGKVIFSLNLPLTKPANHHNFRMVRKLKNGNYLVCHSGQKTVREYTPKGKVVFQVKVPDIAFSAVRLPDGNTMVGHINAITEFDPKGNTVWDFKPKRDLPGLNLGMICGLHVQPSGNIAMGFYRILKEGNGAEFLEITREKKLVWKYLSAKPPRARMGIQVLDAKGKPLADPMR